MYVLVSGYPTYNPDQVTTIYRGLHDRDDTWDKQLLHNIVSWYIDRGWELTVIYFTESAYS
jgi:hypothetical protein